MTQQSFWTTQVRNSSASSWSFQISAANEGGVTIPTYEYGKEYPFAAFITNLGKYNEGALVGEWVKFPTTADELKKVFERIGIGSEDAFGQPYEEWFITDYDCYVGGLYDKLGEYANLDELNYLASKLDDMDQSEYERFQAAMEIGDHTGSIQDLINLTENLDCYDIYPDIEDHDDLGRYYIDELEAMQVPDHLLNYIDYEAYGRDVALEEGGEFTAFGYVRDTGDTFYEVYDGDRENIPEEYRVMNFRDEDFLDVDVAAIREALQSPDTSHVDEMLAFAEQAEREYAADAEAYEETPESILEQARAVFGEQTQNDRHDKPEKKPSIRERLEDAKRECAERKPLEIKRPGRDVPEHGDL